MATESRQTPHLQCPPLRLPFLCPERFQEGFWGEGLLGAQKGRRNSPERLAAPARWADTFAHKGLESSPLPAPTALC